jgi:hypothetical protein
MPSVKQRWFRFNGLAAFVPRAATFVCVDKTRPSRLIPAGGWDFPTGRVSLRVPRSWAST